MFVIFDNSKKRSLENRRVRLVLIAKSFVWVKISNTLNRSCTGLLVQSVSVQNDKPKTMTVVGLSNIFNNLGRLACSQGSTIYILFISFDDFSQRQSILQKCENYFEKKKSLSEK